MLNGTDFLYNWGETYRVWRAVCVKTNFYSATNSSKRRTLFERRIHRSDEFYQVTNSWKRRILFERRIHLSEQFLRAPFVSKLIFIERRILVERRIHRRDEFLSSDEFNRGHEFLSNDEFIEATNSWQRRIFCERRIHRSDEFFLRSERRIHRRPSNSFWVINSCRVTNYIWAMNVYLATNSSWATNSSKGRIQRNDELFLKDEFLLSDEFFFSDEFFWAKKFCIEVRIFLIASNSFWVINSCRVTNYIWAITVYLATNSSKGRIQRSGRIVLNFYRGMNSFFSDEFFLSEEILYRGTNFFKRRILFER